MKTIKALLIICLLASLPSFAQEKAEKTTPVHFLNLEPIALLPEGVRETSGLFFYNGRLWTHNDSGGKPILYALDTSNFQIVQRITIENAKNKDWEDVCIDDKCVYVGDFGNNKGSRKNLRIFFFPLSDIPEQGDAAVTADSIRFRFADQTNFEKRKQAHDFDCEAMFSTDQHLYLISKGWKTGTSRIYRLSKTSGEQVAEVVNSFNPQGLITGADYDKETGLLVMTGYVKDIWRPFLYCIQDFEEHKVLDTKDALGNYYLDLPGITGLQVEGICFYTKGKCFVTAETSPTISARVFQIDFLDWIKKEIEKDSK